MVDYVDEFEMPTSDVVRADARLNVRFSLEPRLDNAKIELTGKEAYRDIFAITLVKTAAVAVAIGVFYLTGIY